MAAAASSRCAATVRSLAAREAKAQRLAQAEAMRKRADELLLDRLELLRQADTLDSPSAGATGEMPGAAPPLPMDFVEGLD